MRLQANNGPHNYDVFNRHLEWIGEVTAKNLQAALDEAKREYDVLASVQRVLTDAERRQMEREAQDNMWYAMRGRA